MKKSLDQRVHDVATLLDVYHCPVTGQLIVTTKHDDKAICTCREAQRRGGTHYKAELKAATALEYVKHMEELRRLHKHRRSRRRGELQ